MASLDVLRSTPGLSKGDVERYADKPLLVLIEAYVLDCIGELAAERASLASKMVARTFGTPPSSDWRSAIRLNLDLPASLDDEVRELWRGNLGELSQPRLGCRSGCLRESVC